jgi:WD40 repeat protein
LAAPAPVGDAAWIDDDRLALQTGAAVVPLVSARTGKAAGTLSGHRVAVSAIDSNGRWLVTGDVAGQIRLWDTAGEYSIVVGRSRGAATADVVVMNDASAVCLFADGQLMLLALPGTDVDSNVEELARITTARLGSVTEPKHGSDDARR